MASYREIMTLLRFFRFMANVEQSGSRIPDARSVKLSDKKMLIFCIKNADISKIKGVLELKGIFSETT